MKIRFADSRPTGDYALVLPAAGKDRIALDSLGAERARSTRRSSRQRFEGEAGSAAELFIRRRWRRSAPCHRRHRRRNERRPMRPKSLAARSARLLTSGETQAVIDLTGLGYDADAAARVALAAALRGMALRPLPDQAQGQAEADPQAN